MHEPLSKKLADILEANSSSEGVTLNHLLERTEGRGFYLVVILLSLPFILPVSIPGVSTVLGLTVALLSFKLAFGAVPRLPKFMGNRNLSPEFQKKILRGSVKLVRVVEKLVKPRRTPWMSTRPARFANATLMKSAIDISSDGLSSLTNRKRAMVGQAPYVINAGTTWATPSNRATATVVYNIVGRRITAAVEHVTQQLCGMSDRWLRP